MKSVSCSKPGYTTITCSKISSILYNLIFTTKVNDSSILITTLSCDYLNLSLTNGYVGIVTIPSQVIKYVYNQFFTRRTSHSDCSIQIKLNYCKLTPLYRSCRSGYQEGRVAMLYVVDPHFFCLQWVNMRWHYSFFYVLTESLTIDHSLSFLLKSTFHWLDQRKNRDQFYTTRGILSIEERKCNIV